MDVKLEKERGEKRKKEKKRKPMLKGKGVDE